MSTTTHTHYEVRYTYQPNGNYRILPPRPTFHTLRQARAFAAEVERAFFHALALRRHHSIEAFPGQELAKWNAECEWHREWIEEHHDEGYVTSTPRVYRVDTTETELDRVSAAVQSV